MSEPINQFYMGLERQKATDGMTNVVWTNLYPLLRIYRFANADNDKSHFASAWWIGFSPFEALKQNAKRRGISIYSAAAQCLAIPSGCKVNVVHEAIIKERLAAWSGTPRTLSPQKVGVRLEPDRRITQLYIAGMGKPDPHNASQAIWEIALQKPRRLVF